MQAAEKISENHAREKHMALADCCRLFAACFYPPDEKLFLDEGLTEKLGALLKITCPKAALPVPPIDPYLTGENAVALKISFTRLFLGPPKVLAPPYASYYLDKTGGVMGPSCVAIAKLYNGAGLHIDDEFNEMPDHVAVILEFLYFLLFREATADSGSEEKNNENGSVHFLNHFLFPWMPEFLHRIREADEHPFYNGLSQCLDTFLRHGFSKIKGAYR